MRAPPKPVEALVRVALGAGVGALAGLASAVFLTLLELATHTRTSHEELVYGLPFAGLLLGFVYERFGQVVRAGNDLVVDRAHEGGDEIPLRLVPMVLGGTVLTHLVGGSAGREGTAVQMGAGLADAVAHRLKLGPERRRELLLAGVAGGFGSVFGTPIAGTLFALELVVVGRVRYGALLPALAAALVGDLVTRGLGVTHGAYPALATVPLTPLLLIKWLVFSAAIALTATTFIEALHGLKKLAARLVPRLPVRLALGGAALVILWKLSGTSDYLGLGLPTIERAFHDASLPNAAFAWKLAFTVVTLGAGFIGGEVTPLFVIGATLGAVLARVLGIPVELGAGVGLAAMFAAASNTPLALSIMAVELLGAGAFPHVMLVAVVAYALTGHRSIYAAQRVLEGKDGSLLETATALRDWPREPRLDRASDKNEREA